MGKTKINIVSQETGTKKSLSSEEEYKLRQAKKAQEKAKAEVSQVSKVSKVSEATTADSEAVISKQVPQSKTKEKKEKTHGKKYLAALAKLDPTKTYSAAQAAKLVKETSFSKFDGSVELHLVLNSKNVSQNIEMPYSTGQVKRLEIASDETVAKLEAGKVDFDILLASPETMPKLVKFAKLLGPRGLMPNPKNGTLVDDPQKAVANFSGKTLRAKTEKDAPLVHLVVAKVSQPEAEIEENVKAVISGLGPKTVTKAVISASMGPGIRLTL